MADALAKIHEIVIYWQGSSFDKRAFTICLLIFIPLALVYSYFTYKEE